MCVGETWLHRGLNGKSYVLIIKVKKKVIVIMEFTREEKEYLEEFFLVQKDAGKD